jgi:hypothetical protein
LGLQITYETISCSRFCLACAYCVLVF